MATGWRVLIDTRNDGPIQGPVHSGEPTDAEIAADAQWLRTGRYRDRNWPEISGAGEPYIEVLSDADVADEARLAAATRANADQIDALKAGVA